MGLQSVERWRGWLFETMIHAALGEQRKVFCSLPIFPLEEAIQSKPSRSEALPLIYGYDFQLKMRRIGKRVEIVDMLGEQLYSAAVLGPKERNIILIFVEPKQKSDGRCLHGSQLQSRYFLLCWIGSYETSE